jgi:DNA-binding CsgD family transcriptional regulator
VLSSREHQVLELVADGLSNKLIAERLGLSEHTAKFHVRSLLDKLGADTRADAVARAARRGLLSL